MNSSKWWGWVVAGVVVGALIGLTASLLTPTLYSATSRIVVSEENLVPGYLKILRGDQVIAQASAAIDEDQGRFLQYVRFERVIDSRAIRIVAEATTAESATETASAVTGAALVVLNGNDAAPSSAEEVQVRSSGGEIDTELRYGGVGSRAIVVGAGVFAGVMVALLLMSALQARNVQEVEK